MWLNIFKKAANHSFSDVLEEALVSNSYTYLFNLRILDNEFQYTYSGNRDYFLNKQILPLYNISVDVNVDCAVQ